MMEFVVPPVPIPSVPVLGGGKFPVRRIFCIGKNYSDHIREMGDDVMDQEPVIFCKPADAICHATQVTYPSKTSNLHFEGELVVALKGPARGVTPQDAASKIFGYAVGCDLTRRDLQAQAKARKGPWDTAKGLDNGAIIGRITPISACGLLTQGRIELEVDGKIKQSSNLDKMIWPVDKIISMVSSYFDLCAGDLLYTGTPEGVGAIAPGNCVKISIDGVQAHQFTLV